jgi:hypothetical protein|tara:strand:+ start:1393 stop:1566 length:174 start_codon:yes stop_codon:yes gene_type:complete
VPVGNWYTSSSAIDEVTDINEVIDIVMNAAKNIVSIRFSNKELDKTRIILKALIDYT